MKLLFRGFLFVFAAIAVKANGDEKVTSASAVFERPRLTRGRLSEDDFGEDVACRDVAMPLSVFTLLDSVCDDCYDLFRMPQVYSLCRADCFTSEYFGTCMDALLVSDEFRRKAAGFLEGSTTANIFD